MIVVCEMILDVKKDDFSENQENTMTGEITMYCSICGNELETKEIHNEGVIPYCANCNKLYFPRVDIATISILTNSRNEVCLTTQNKEGTYKVLIAGFVKPGESLEECVKREIKEEIGIDVATCEYLNSYHYDKNDVLMVGFHATTDQYDFALDETEIKEASWHQKEECLSLIRSGSIAHRLMKQFLMKSEMGEIQDE